MGSHTSVNKNEIILAAIEYLNEALEYKIISYHDTQTINTRWARCNNESLYIEFCGDVYLIRIRNYNMELLYIGQSVTETSSLQFNNSGRIAAAIDLSNEGLDPILRFFEFNEALSKGDDAKLINITLGGQLKPSALCDKVDRLIVEDQENNMLLEISLNDSVKPYEFCANYRSKNKMSNYIMGEEGENLFYYQELYMSYRKRNRIFNVVYNHMSDFKVRYTKGFNLRDVRSYHRISKWFTNKSYTKRKK